MCQQNDEMILNDVDVNISHDTICTFAKKLLLNLIIDEMYVCCTKKKILEMLLLLYI